MIIAITDYQIGLQMPSTKWSTTSHHSLWSPDWCSSCFMPPFQEKKEKYISITKLLVYEKHLNHRITTKFGISESERIFFSIGQGEVLKNPSVRTSDGCLVLRLLL